MARAQESYGESLILSTRYHGNGRQRQRPTTFFSPDENVLTAAFQQPTEQRAQLGCLGREKNGLLSLKHPFGSKTMAGDQRLSSFDFRFSHLSETEFYSKAKLKHNSLPVERVG